MTQRGRGLGRQQSDPMSVLDTAMDAVVQDLDRSGSGVEVEDVTGASERPEREPRSRTRVERRDRDESGRFTPRRPARSAPVLDDDADDDDDLSGTFADDEDDEPAPRRRTARRTPSLPTFTADDDEDEDAEDDDLDDDEDEDESDGRRRRAPADEDEDDDDDLDLEGERGAVEDEGDEEPERRTKKGSRRKRWPASVKKQIDAAVEARVSKVIEERDTLRQQAAKKTEEESKAIDFLLKAIGTPQERQRLQGIVNDTRKPIAERNQAAALLTRYQANEGYAQQYRTALLASLRTQEAEESKQVTTKFGEYGIKLDPAILNEGHRAKIMVHVAREAIKMERARGQKVIEKLKRQLDTARGVRTDREVRSGLGRSSRRNGTMASSNGRRANGRPPSRSMPRGALTQERGMVPGSKIVLPSDDALAGLRSGDLTLADLKL